MQHDSPSREHRVEDVANSIILSSVLREHYDERMIDILGVIRFMVFRTAREQHALSSMIDTLRFRYTTMLSAFLEDDDIQHYINDLNAARDECSIDEYELCRTIRFLHATGCELLHWI